MKNNVYAKIAMGFLLSASVINAAQQPQLPIIYVQLHAKKAVPASEIAISEFRHNNKQLCKNFNLSYNDIEMLMQVEPLVQNYRTFLNWTNHLPSELQTELVKQRNLDTLKSNTEEEWFRDVYSTSKHPQYLPERLFIDKKLGDDIELTAYGCRVKATIMEFPTKAESPHALLKFINMTNTLETLKKPFLYCSIGAIVIYVLWCLKKK
jgi:hypothetical protein